MDSGGLRSVPVEWLLCSVVLLLAVAVGPTSGYGDGAPTSICTSMLPAHGNVQASASPYTIHVSETEYAAGGHLIGEL